MALFADNIVAKLDTLVTDENRRTGDQLADFVLGLATEGAVEKLLTTRFLSHISLSSSPRRAANKRVSFPQCRSPQAAASMAPVPERLSNRCSTKPYFTESSAL